ncbi:unnamed protein product [Brassica oleracea]
MSNEKEIENKNMNVSTNMFEVLFGPPRTGGRLESRICKPWGSSSTLGTYRSCGVVSNEAPAGLWGSGLTRVHNPLFGNPVGRRESGRYKLDFLQNRYEPSRFVRVRRFSFRSRKQQLRRLSPWFSVKLLAERKSQLTYGLNFATTAVGVLAGTFPGVVMRRLKLGPAQCRGFKNATQVLRSKLGDGETRRVILKAVYLFHIGANDYQYISSQTRHLLVPRPKRGSWTSLSVTQRTSSRINDPSRYGFKQGKMACCGSGPLRGVDTCGFRNGPSQGYELCENSGDY